MLPHSNKLVHPLSAAKVLGGMPILKEPRLIGDWVLWLEQRPEEGGRTTALIRPWGLKGLVPIELTPSPINLRTRVHSYGGGALAIAKKGSQLLITWIDDQDGRLWMQSFEGLENTKEQQQVSLIACQEPIALSSKASFSLADGFLDLTRNRWIGVMEIDEKDYLVAFSLAKENQNPRIIHVPNDFVGYASLSPNQDQLVWIEWSKTDMPWDASELWWGSFDDSGEITQKRLLLGSRNKDLEKISIFQPFWMPNGQLAVSEDTNGWWNLSITSQKIEFNQEVLWKNLWPMDAETGLPQWVFGMCTNSSAGKKILSANCYRGRWRLQLLSNNGLIKDLDQPFDSISGIDSNAYRAVAIASNCFTSSGILEIDLKDNHWQHMTIKETILQDYEISIAQDFWFKGYLDRPTHAWYYPPKNNTTRPAPLLVKSHSGPTAMASNSLNLGIQFWTSRGWGVVDVNYGGSTGFGRAYRDRLLLGWGKVDVFDCAAAAKALIAEGKADEKRIAIEGGSAGGFTTLACLCFTDVFSVAACRYAVSDLKSMSQETHRFEAGYLDSLVGKLDRDMSSYEERSPINHFKNINCPVIFFQGLKDKVVLPQQTLSIVSQLKLKNLPVELHDFPDEGHGFRDGTVKIKVLNETERFFNKHLEL